MPFRRSRAYYSKRFHAKQEEAWLAYKAGLTPVLPWGRRSGKSDLFSEILIEDIEENGYPCLFIAKTRIQAREIIWDKFKVRLKDQPGWRLNDSKLEAIYKRGPAVRLKGADKDVDTLAGSGYRLIACDEYALWRNPDVVGKVLAPMLGDYNGQFLFGSTKRGKNHLFKLQERAKSEPDKYFTSEATIFDNPFIGAAGREKVLSEYEGGDKNPLYRQEILNEYVVFEGMVFALPVETYTERKWDLGELEHCHHWRGMDHGFSPDPTAAVWIAYSKRFKRFQVYSEYKQQALLIKQHADIIQAQEHYRFTDSISDIDPQVIAEYEAVGLTLTPADKSDKQARLLKLVNALRTGRVKIAYNCTQLLDEMASLTWEDVEKAKGDDHLVDAFDYGFNGLAVPPSYTKEVEEYPPIRGRGYGGDFSQSFGD